MDKFDNRQLKSMSGFQFEYSAESNVLGEWKSDGNRPEDYVTAVDLKLETKDENDNPVLFLIEVKFTEATFTTCGGFDSGGNTPHMRIACDDAQQLYADPQLCYLHGSRSKGKLKRKYFNHFEPMGSHFEKEAFRKKCPFVEVHQCLRNHALARHHRSKGGECYFVLLRHEDNRGISLEWQKYLHTLQPPVQSELFSITGKEVVEHSGIRVLMSYYRDRYTLPYDGSST